MVILAVRVAVGDPKPDILGRLTTLSVVHLGLCPGPMT